MYSGFSSHSVPSLSNVAMRSAGGTKSGPPAVVTFVTKSRMALLAAPSFQEVSGSVIVMSLLVLEVQITPK